MSCYDSYNEEGGLYSRRRGLRDSVVPVQDLRGGWGGRPVLRNYNWGVGPEVGTGFLVEDAGTFSAHSTEL